MSTGQSIDAIWDDALHDRGTAKWLILKLVVIIARTVVEIRDDQKSLATSASK